MPCGTSAQPGTGGLSTESHSPTGRAGASERIGEGQTKKPSLLFGENQGQLLTASLEELECWGGFKELR